MNTPKKTQQTNDSKKQGQDKNMSLDNDDLEDDGTPVLDEADLAENNLTVEEAEEIEWEEPAEDEFDDADGGSKR